MAPPPAPEPAAATGRDVLGAQVRRLAQALIGGEGAPADRPGFSIAARRGLVFTGARQFAFVGAHNRLCIGEHRHFTIEAWLVPNGSGVLVGRLDTGTYPQGEFALGLDEAGHPCFDYLAGDSGDTRSRARLTSSVALSFGRLTHVAVTGDARTLTLYVDGEAVARREATLRPLRPERVPLLLGAALHERQPAHFLRGTLVALTIHRSCLDADAVRGAAYGRRAPQRQLIVATWNFHEGDGFTTLDESGAGHHASLGKGLPQFAPAWATPRLWIGPGSYFVDGLLCENPAAITFDAQPQAPGGTLPLLRDGEQLTVYLHVWERAHARGSAPVVQVKVCRSERWPRLQRRPADLPELAVRRRPDAPAPLARGYRLEVHTPGWVLGSDVPVGDCAAVASVDFVAQRIVLARPSGAGEDWFEPYAQAGAIEVAAGARSRGDPADRAMVLAADAGSATLSLDFLPPVLSEPHTLFVRPLATFKWSRDDGAVAFSVAPAGRDSLEVRPRASAPRLPEVGSWVELVDERTELGRLPGSLRQIRAIVHASGGANRLTLDGALPAGYAAGDAQRGQARLWSINPATRGPALQVARDGWVELEDGIEVRFSRHGVAQPGDHWSFRVGPELPGGLSWPSQAGAPATLKPQGAERHLARLATLWYERGRPRVRDERSLFDVLGHQVDRTGDTMTGRLRIGADLEVSGESRLNRVRVGELHGRLAPGIVGTEQLLDGSVSLSKLAEDIGTVPPGYCILGPRPQAPTGYRTTGSSLEARHDQPRWVPMARGVPEGGRHHAAVLGRSLYLLFEGSGQLWEWNLAVADAQWRARAALPAPRPGLALAAFAGRLHVAGGRLAGTGRSSAHQAYDPAEDRWVPAADLPRGRSELALCASGGRLYAIGGHAGAVGERCSAQVDCYEPALRQWSKAPPLPRGVAGASAASLGSRIFLLGGECAPGPLRRAQPTARCLLFSVAAGRWREIAPLPALLRGASAATLAGRVFLAGGEAGGNTARMVYAYLEAQDEWEETGPMGAARSGLSLAGDPESRTLFALGGNARNNAESCQLATRLFVHAREHDSRLTTQATALMERVVECTRAGRLRDAADLLRQAVSLSPANFALRASLSELLIQILLLDGRDDGLLMEIEAQLESMTALQPRSAQLDRLSGLLEQATSAGA